ncbi:MAG: M28 family peptidase [Pyrinomonadaceae bacterium]|nr:M28 family peptidase [Pyrinomonadaceae bacterium]
MVNFGRIIGAVLFFYILSIAVAGQTVPASKDFASAAQIELLAKLTGKKAVKVSFEIGNEKRTLKRQREVKLTDRYSVFARKASANLLYRSLRQEGIKPQRHSYTTELGHVNTPKQGTNIYAIIPATIKSDEYVLLGAHYDSVKGSPGANDNASGTVLVLGVALQILKLNERKRNFIIVFFDQEERGLIGSRMFARKLKRDGMNLHSAHTVDQMGWDADGDKAIEIELPTPALEKAYRQEAAKLSITVHKTNVPSTDHTAFREIGFNAIGVTEEYKKRRHDPALPQRHGYL